MLMLTLFADAGTPAWMWPMLVILVGSNVALFVLWIRANFSIERLRLRAIITIALAFIAVQGFSVVFQGFGIQINTSGQDLWPIAFVVGIAIVVIAWLDYEEKKTLAAETFDRHIRAIVLGVLRDQKTLEQIAEEERIPFWRVEAIFFSVSRLITLLQSRNLI